MKFIRRYRIEIISPFGDNITVEPPFSVKFNITRNTLASANKTELTIYNLSPSTRSKIFKDRYQFSDIWQLTIWAGYETLYRCFRGNIFESTSSKIGPDWVTTIDGFDGLNALQNSFTSESFAAGTDRSDIIQSLVETMPNIALGTIGVSGQGSITRGQSFVGNSFRAIQELTNNNAFIDENILNVLNNDETLGDFAYNFDQRQLFATPRRRNTLLDVTTLFNPEIQIGYLAQLTSQEAIYNGAYKIMGFTHDVEILSNKNGKATTDAFLFAGAEGLRSAT